MASNYRVVITESARKDILHIWRYIVDNDSVGQADEIYKDLRKEIGKLRHFPQKGHVVPELERIDVYDYLGVRLKPYRIVYSIEIDEVVAYAVIDGRRDLMSSLSKRLFR